MGGLFKVLKKKDEKNNPNVSANLTDSSKCVPDKLQSWELEEVDQKCQKEKVNGVYSELTKQFLKVVFSRKCSCNLKVKNMLVGINTSKYICIYMYKKQELPLIVGICNIYLMHILHI